MINNQIDTILFDLGGVILDLDKDKCFNEFSKLGIDLSESGLGFYGQSGLLGELELGRIEEEDFYHRFRAQHKVDIGNDEIRSAWNSFLVGIPETRLNFLKMLKKKYKLYLLSNTSKIHHDYWQSMFHYSSNEVGAHHFFEGIFCSFETHIAKPDVTAFETVIHKTSINPDHTLFFDDSQANIDSAKYLGFKTTLVNEGEKLEEIYIDKLI